MKSYLPEYQAWVICQRSKQTLKPRGLAKCLEFNITKPNADFIEQGDIGTILMFYSSETAYKYLDKKMKEDPEVFKCFDVFPIGIDFTE